jgi:hypothetical protein
VGVRLLTQLHQCACQASQQASVLTKEGRFWACGAPESQTLIVLSSDPDTIFDPSGENATEWTWALWAFVFSLSSFSLPARQGSRSQFWPRRGDFEGKSAPESQTSIVPSLDPDTILVPSGENATDVMARLCAFFFLLSSPSAPAGQANRRQFWPRRGDFEGKSAPESQTLTVWSHDPDTILVPSGENATDVIGWLWAFVFSLNCTIVPARQASKRQF